MSTDPWAALGARLDEVAKDEDTGGTVLVTVGQEVLAHRCVGPADRASGLPITGRTRFALASLSKMFTATAVLLALQEHRIDVHTPVVELLPAHRRPRTLDPSVTVHHLLTHTSGIGDYAEEDEDLPGYVEDYGALWVDRPVSAMQRPDDFLPLYADAPPVSAPGAEFHYCNAGFVLLGAVLEQVTGGVFVDVVTDTVLRPAGMASSGYLRTDDQLPDLAMGQLPPARAGDPWRSNVFSVPVIGGGDGGAVATAADVERFLRALADGSLLGPELTARMLTRHVLEDGDMWMGYGVYVGEDGRFGHDGGDPGVETFAMYYPAADACLVVLANVEGFLAQVFQDARAAIATLESPV
jgi:D-alanyl-D-alanine carboxypeptidase